MRTSLILLVIAPFLLFTTITAAFTALTYVAPEKDKIFFRFSLVPGKFRPENRITIKFDSNSVWEQGFVPLSTPTCRFEHNIDLDFYYLEVSMTDQTQDVATFEQSCLGDFTSATPLNTLLTLQDGSEADWQTFNTTLAPLRNLTANDPPTFVPSLSLAPAPTPTQHRLSTQQLTDDPVPSTPNQFGLPWEAGLLTFFLTFDRELPAQRQAFLFLNNVPSLDSCSYTVASSPVAHPFNPNRLASLVTQTPVDPANPNPTSGLFNTIFDLVHLPYLTLEVDETQTAIYLFDDDGDAGSQSDAPDGWTGTLKFQCKCTLPSQQILTQDPPVPYTAQLSSTKDLTDPELVKYYAITVPLELQAIGLIEDFEPFTILKLSPASLTLPDSCQMTSETPTPTCELQIKLGLDATEVYPTPQTELVIPSGSKIHLRLEAKAIIFSDISLCTLSTVDSFASATQTLILVTTSDITLALSPLRTTTILRQNYY